MIVFPHGIGVDRDGNVWVTDGNDNAPAAGARWRRRRRAAPRALRGGAGAAAARQQQPDAAAAPVGAAAGATKGHQVFKFSPDGKLLLTLGKPGGAAEPDYFYQPNDVLVAPNGDIFVVGAARRRRRLDFKFDKTGKFLQEVGPREWCTEPRR